MNGKWVEKIRVALICVLILISVPFKSRAVSAKSIEPKSSGEQQLLNASVQIIMSVFQKPQAGSGASQNNAGNRILANGIGSIIEVRGEVLIVTHNHWGAALQRMSLVEFRDAENELLLRLFGFQFQALIRYQDKGTLVLDIPDDLEPFLSAGVGGSNNRGGLIPGKSGNSGKVKPGAIVEVAYRQGGNRQEIGSLRAVVESVAHYKGLPIFRLRSLNGQPVLPGDSGGGIWFNGKLVGNLWASLAVGSQPVAGQSSGNSAPGSVAFSDISYAAILDSEVVQ